MNFTTHYQIGLNLELPIKVQDVE